MYWGQAAVGIAGASVVLIYSLSAGVSLVIAGILATLTYIFARWILAWIFRTRYWYRNDGYQSHSCPNCGQFIDRMGGDWILTCHRCHWKAGWPLLRWFTHSVPVKQLRHTVIGPQFVIAVLLVSGVIITGLHPDVVSNRSDKFSPQHLNDAISDISNEEEVDSEDVELRITQLVNGEREQHGLSPLIYREEVADVARSHSEDMLEHEFMGHEGSDGGQPIDRIQRAGVDCLVGENVAQTYVDRRVRTSEGTVIHRSTEDLASGLVNQWMNSPGHRANILNEDYRSHGVGIVISDDGFVYATHKFCL